MDKDIYHQKRAKEHQSEISQELATRNVLNGGKRGTHRETGATLGVTDCVGRHRCDDLNRP